MAIPDIHSRVEAWLAFIAGEADEPPEPPRSRVEWWLKYIADNGGGGSGTDNYNALSNKPKINGVTLTGDKSLDELNIKALTADEISAMWEN